MVHRPTRRQLVQLAVAFAAGVVVILLVLVGLGILVLPTSGSAKVTVSEVQWKILQGYNSNGQGWFGPGEINETDADGLPVQVNSGGSASFTVQLLGSNRTIYSVTSASSGFTVTSTTPAMPCTATGVDEFRLSATVTVPNVSSGASYVLQLVVNGLNPPPG